MKSSQEIIRGIYDECWDNLTEDLTPKDRRMKILAEHGVDGMSTENVRFLINEIVRQFAANGVYLEIGVYRGCSLLSAALFNETTRCIGIDMFGYFNYSNDNERLCRENILKLYKSQPPRIEVHRGQYQRLIPAIFKAEPDLKVDVFYYDGVHTYEQQLAALELMVPHLSEQCAILVDDINWSEPERANQDFLKAHPDFKSTLKIKQNAYCKPPWWNGFEVMTR